MNRYEVYFADGTSSIVMAFDSDAACALAQALRIRADGIWALNSNKPYALLCDRCDSPLCEDEECLLCPTEELSL